MAIIDGASSRNTSFAPAGTTQATATPVQDKVVLTATFGITATGAILVEKNCVDQGFGTIYNGNANTGPNLEIYPWSGAAFNGQTADASVSLPPGKGMRWEYLTATKIGVIFS